MTSRAVALLALVSGCDVFGGGGGGDDDEPPHDGGPTGLTLRWESRPEVIPSERITRATFELSNLRVVGDAGPLAFGARTLVWAAGDEPGEITNPDAPSGLYSRCLFDLVAPSGGYAYEIEGIVEQNDMKVPFKIRDRMTAAISAEFSEMLAPGGEAKIEVEVRIDELAAAVDFSQVPLQNGVLLVEEGGTQLPRVRLQLASAFDVED